MDTLALLIEVAANGKYPEFFSEIQQPVMGQVLLDDFPAFIIPQNHIPLILFPAQNTTVVFIPAQNFLVSVEFEALSVFGGKRKRLDLPIKQDEVIAVFF